MRDPLREFLHHLRDQEAEPEELPETETEEDGEEEERNAAFRLDVR